MNTEESRLLQSFLEQLTAVRGIDKDPHADALIRDAVARQPDAAYLLVQRAMILEQALDQAKAEMERLRREVQPPPAATQRRFLDAHAWGKSAQSTGSALGTGQALSAAGTPLSMPATRVGQASLAPAAGMRGLTGPGSRFGGGAGGSFLGTMAATAAGVAGGAFLFHGIGNLLNDTTDDSGSDPLAGNASESGDAAQAPEAIEPANVETEDLASADDSGSLFDDSGSNDFGGGDDSLL